MSSKSLRSLMKDRQLAKRIQHQFAKYDSLGRLTCTICNGLTVKSETLWPSHLNSKSHRINYQKKQDQGITRINEALINHQSISTNVTDSILKRKITDHTHQYKNILPEKKIRFEEPSSSISLKESEEILQKNELESNQISSSLPNNFFDDPSEAPRTEETSEDKQEEKEIEEEDLEWKEFQATLERPSDEEEKPAIVFAQASLIVEPVLYQSNQTETRFIEESQSNQEQNQEKEEEEDPIEKKIREEKEEIMDRIENEEREQFEADQRVIKLKLRIETFKAKLLTKQKKLE